jgi:peptidoglycan/LPS O-acetylase OafA/YrhL
VARQTHSTAAGAAPALEYRPDIDGMRAVAVLAVLLFHAGFAALSGGYVGVDVFFVLTGFLITTIIAEQLRAGTFSFAGFYLRRMRRILPALTLVLAVTSLAGFYLLLPTDLLALLDSARFALLSVSNVYFWLNTGGYFDADIAELPLLHTWSLGVEEQFYLLWPVLLLLGHRYLSRAALAFCVLLAIVFGLSLSQWAALRHAGAAYYLLYGRAFEILMGALLALEGGRARALSQGARHVISLLGLGLVLGPMFLLTPRSTFPGLNALWPCLGTALLLASGADKAQQGIVNRLLSLRPLVLLGLLSYSIYLWHWPLVAYFNYHGERLAGLTRWVVIVAPIGAAAASYVLVERPFRRGVRLGFKASFAALVLTPVAACFALHAWASGRAGFPERFHTLAAEMGRNDATKASGECEYNRDLSLTPICQLGVPSSRIDGLLIGDSYAGMYTDFMDVLARDAGISLRHRWYRRSAPIPGTSFGEVLDPRQAAYTAQRHQLALQHELAVLISSWGNYRVSAEDKLRLWNRRGQDVSPQADALQLAAIDDLVERGVKVILLERPRAPPGKELMKAIRVAAKNGRPLSAFRVPIRERTGTDTLRLAHEKHPSIVLIRPDDVVCDDNACDVVVRGAIMYRNDGSHLTHEASRLLGEEYLKRHPNPLKSIQRSHIP